MIMELAHAAEMAFLAYLLTALLATGITLAAVFGLWVYVLRMFGAGR